MKKPLIILGAGNVGGFLAINFGLFNLDSQLLGFLDDDEKKIGKSVFGFPVLGKIDDIQKYGSDLQVAIGIASPNIKKKIVSKLAGMSIEFPSFIASNAWISNEVKVGKGCIIYPGVSINHYSMIGDFVIMNMNCAIGHDSHIGDYSSLAPGVNFGGFTHLESSVDMGIGACTIQRVRIGEGVIVGGQTMIIENVPAFSTIVGVPARKIADAPTG